MSAVQLIRLVTVIGPTRSGDFAVAADAYAKNVAAQLVTLLGEDESQGWRLTRADGQWLGITHSLASEGIRDGEILHLVTDRDNDHHDDDGEPT